MEEPDRIRIRPSEYMWALSAMFILGTWAHNVRWLFGLIVIVMFFSMVAFIISVIQTRRKS